MQKSKYKGVIGKYGLDAFWEMLSTDEQEIVSACYREQFTEEYTYTDYDDDNNKKDVSVCEEAISPIVDDVSGIKIDDFFSGIAFGLFSRDLKLLMKVVTYVLEMPLIMETDEEYVDAHFLYQGMAEFLYYHKDVDKTLELCIAFCQKDIDIFAGYKPAFLRQDARLPLLLSFKRLAIIYEKEGNYEEAIKICEQAIEYNLHDGTKGGYKGRLERIRKKIAKVGE